MKKFLALLMCLAIALSMVACGGSGGKSKTSGTKDYADMTIGWSVYNIAYEYFISMEQGVVDKANELGVKLLKHDQGEDATAMVTGCENLIAQGVDALVISPCKPESMTQIVAAADEAGIPVVVVDIGTGGSDYDCFIISDVYGGGQMAAGYTLEVLKSKNITGKDYAVIKCEESAVYAIQRGEGFKDVMDKEGYNFTTQITANSSQDQGYNAMKDILTAHPDVVAVYCENDKMAMGAANAVEEAGKTGDIVIMGFDGDAAALEFVKEGKMAGTIAQDPHGMGGKGLEIATKLVRGEKITFDQEDLKQINFPVKLVEGAVASASSSADYSDLKIGWSVYNIAYEYFISMEQGVVEKAKELGIELLKHDQGEDATAMVTGCENLIAQGIDALVISPCKPESMTQIVAAADEAGIPVVVVDIGTGGSDYDCFIISDVFGGGQMAAKYTQEILKSKNIAGKNYAVIKCEESAVYAIQRGEGFKDVMDKEGYNFTTQITANSSQDQGYNAMKDILTAHPDVVAVYCENDKMAMGAANAVEEAGKAGSIAIMGFDGDAAAVEFIKEGKMAGTIAQDPQGMGAKGLEVAAKLAKKESVSFDDASKKQINFGVYLIDKDGNADRNFK